MSASEAFAVNSAKISLYCCSLSLFVLLCFNLPTAVDADVSVVEPERPSRPRQKDDTGFYQSEEKNSQDVKDAFMEQLANELKGRMLKVTTLEVSDYTVVAVTVGVIYRKLCVIVCNG